MLKMKSLGILEPLRPTIKLKDSVNLTDNGYLYKAFKLKLCATPSVYSAMTRKTNRSTQTSMCQELL
jgi:hypothetical protein